MSDIGFHGLGAFVVFLFTSFLFAGMLLIALIFFFIEKRKKDNIKHIKASGFIISSICGLIFLFLLMVFLEKSYNRDLFKLLDDLSLFIAPAILGLAVWFGVWYRKRVSRINPGSPT